MPKPKVNLEPIASNGSMVLQFSEPMIYPNDTYLLNYSSIFEFKLISVLDDSINTGEFI